MTIRIPPLITKRLKLELKPLTIGDAIKLASMPTSQPVATQRLFLQSVIEHVEGVTDLGEWTVQEQMLVVGHYLAATSSGDFDVSNAQGETVGHFSDYLILDRDYGLPVVPLGSLEGDLWSMRHMTGAMAEIIERVAAEYSWLSPYTYWLVAGMAVQLLVAGEDSPVPGDNSADLEGFDRFLVRRIATLLAFPESEFESLVVIYHTGRHQLMHLMDLSFDRVSGGLMALPKEGAAPDVPPVRFRLHSCLSDLAHELVGKSQITRP